MFLNYNKCQRQNDSKNNSTSLKNRKNAIGRKYIESNEYKKAVAALSHALKTTLNNEKVYYLRAVAYSKLAEGQKALENIKTAARLAAPKSY